MTMDKETKVRQQSEFCSQLGVRLNTRIQEARFSNYYHPEGYSSIQEDIKRLRRELLQLSEMVNPTSWYWRKDKQNDD